MMGPEQELAALRAELAQVKEHRDALWSLIEAAPIAFITLDGEGRVDTWNAHAERLFGWSRQEAVGNLVPFVSPQNMGEFLSRHKAQQDSDQPINELEVRRKRKDGSLIDISVSTSLIRDDGEVKQIIGAIADISERKEAQRQLEELNHTLEERVERRTEELQRALADLESFSYSVSHDLRSPIRAIAGYAQVLEEDFEAQLGEDGMGYLGRILKGTERMASLIDDLLHFARTSRQPLNCRLCDMNELVAEICQELRAVYATAEIVVPDLPPVHGDPNLLRQVWANLIGNALKYSRKRPDSRVEVSAQAGPEEVTYQVKDNGVGFDMRHASKLFEVFKRLHRTEEFEGSGVGLAIVARVLQRHGGSVRGQSVLGQGSTFTFTLPTEGPNA